MEYKPLMKDPEERRVYDKLVETCLCSGSEAEVAKLGCLKLDTSYVFKDFSKKVESFKGEIFQISLSVFIAMWADVTRDNKVYGIEHLKMMCELVETKLLPLTSLEGFVKSDPSSVFENIRCFESWTISKREDVVLLYTSFLLWLSNKTFSCVPEPLDRDRVVSQKRKLSFKTYIGFLERMDLRERILTKMFYLGGSRSFEEVLSVLIESIDFKKGHISFSEDVSYPRHLFEDIKKHIQSRKKGFVFISKDGERISHTTPFRALKKVVIEMKLDPGFTFREFSENN